MAKEKRLSRAHYERLLRLVGLLQDSYCARRLELCAKLEISERSLERDVATLRDYGIQIEAGWGWYGLRL